jgi:ABC-type uncharacterized transport system ATPase subunit
VRVVIGPNGAGKSTLCDTIIGRVRPTSGRVVFRGEEIQRMPEQDIVARGICRKFQAPGVLPTLSVRDNVALAARKDRRWWKSLGFGIPASERENVEAILMQVGLSDLADMPAGNWRMGKSNGWKSAWCWRRGGTHPAGRTDGGHGAGRNAAHGGTDPGPWGGSYGVGDRP